MATKKAIPQTVIDFQAFREERKRKLKPIVVKFTDDVSVELPSQMPASVMLNLMKFQAIQRANGEDGDLNNLPPDMAMDILSDLLGDTRLQEVIEELSLDIGEVFWLIQNLMLVYTSDLTADTEGNALTASDSTSSNIGI